MFQLGDGGTVESKGFVDVEEVALILEGLLDFPGDFYFDEVVGK